MKLSDLTLHQIIKEYGMTAGQPTPVSSQKTGAAAKSNKAKSVIAPPSSPNTNSVSQSPVTGKGALPKATTSSNLVQATAGELPVDTVIKDKQGNEMGVVISKVGNARQPDTVVVKNRTGKFQTMPPNQRVTVQAPVKEFTFDQFVNLPLMEQLDLVESTFVYQHQLPGDLWGEIGNFIGKHTVFRKRYQQALSALKKLMDRKTHQQQTLRHDLEYYAGLISRTYPGVDTRQLADLYRSTISEDGDLDENLRQWFEKEKWVRFGPDGKIRGDCAREDDSEGKPKCLPREKAYRLGKKGRATAARRKRRLDPNAKRKGAAKNVATKKESVTEGYILKKVNVRKYVEPGSSNDYVPDINVKDLDYQIINNKTGQVVGTASWTTNDYMNNGAERYLDIWSSEKGNPQTAFNRFVKDPKTAKKYKDTVVEGKVKLFTDPNYYGAEVDDSGFDRLPVINIPANKLIGFEPDDKMNQPDSRVNVKKIMAALEKGEKLPPILVRKYKNGYQVLDGHHRFWAYKQLNINSIPARLVPNKDIEEIGKQGVAEGVPQPGPSSGAPKQFGPNAEIQTRQMTAKQLIDSVPGLPYYNNVVDDWDAKDYSWGVTKKVIEYATYLKDHPESLAKLPPILVLNGKFEDGAHRVSAIWLLQQRMDPKNPLWKDAKLNVQFVKQGVAEGGAETSWSDGDEKITLQDILELTKHIKQINLPIDNNLKSKLIHWDGNPEEIERINQVTVSNQFPILVMLDGQGQIGWILDGNHRLHKAIKSQAKTIPAKLIKPSDLDDKAKRVFQIKEQGFGKDLKTAKKYKDTVVEDTDIPFSVCPSCGGSIVHESQLTEKKKNKKDACYHKVKAAYRVWPSAYASGALVQCRKMGAANWGKTTNEDVEMNDTLGTEVQKLSSLIKTSKAKSETYRSGKVVPNLVYVNTAESPQVVFELLTQKMGYKKRSGYDTNPETWDAHYSADSMTTKSDSVINQSLGIQAYYEKEHGGLLKVYFDQFKTVSNESTNCAHGKYYCNTDKKWKCRKGPKQSRSLREGALPDNRKIKILNQLLSVPLMGNDVKSQMQAFFAIPSPQMINDFRDAISGGPAHKIDLRPIVRTYVNSLHPDVQKNIDLNESTLMEYSSLDLAKKEIISAVKSIDVSPSDETLAKQNAQLLDKLYNVLNKNNVLNRIGNVLPDMLKGEYSQKEVTKIAQLLAEAPISFNDKDRFADNLKNDKVINSSIFITPGLYTVDQLTYGDPVNKKMLEYMKSYGVGQQMKGPLEHALAIFSKEVSIAGKGDITVAGEPVEVKAAIGDRKGSGGGRFGETGRLPSREKMLSIINSFPQLQPLVDAYLANQKSMNITTFVDIVQQAGVDTATRADIGRKVFGAVFGIEAKPVIAAFSKPNADAEAVRKAYIVSNFNWYKNSDMGGEWKYLAAISLVDNAVAVISSGEDLQKISAYKKNPSIITTDKPQEMLFQFNPRTA